VARSPVRMICSALARPCEHSGRVERIREDLRTWRKRREFEHLDQKRRAATPSCGSSFLRIRDPRPRVGADLMKFAHDLDTQSKVCDRKKTTIAVVWIIVSHVQRH
jgi:hypothetical protein